MTADFDAPPPLDVIDSHTAGEPTRTVVGGGPDLGGGTVADQLERMRTEHDWVRTALIAEPRGCDVIVGAMLVPRSSADCVSGVIFFNCVGYLGMCGHGAIGVVATLAHLGRIRPGHHRLETPVGIIQTRLGEDGRVAIENVPSYRYRHRVPVTLADGRELVGDVAWGGNWFYLTELDRHAIDLANVAELTRQAIEVRQALAAAGITGRGGASIEHVEFSCPLAAPEGVEMANFVLCPGTAYDRSPCGTGTSAKVACLAADGLLEAGQWMRMRGICGGQFEASFRRAEEMVDGIPQILPTVVGRAFINARLQVVFDPQDPFRFGIGVQEQIVL